jgi:hypothetical protein
MDAFKNALFMQHMININQVEHNIKKSFNEREAIFDVMDKLKLLP